MIKKTTLIALLVTMSVVGACGKANDEDTAPITFKIAWRVKANQEIIMGPRAILAGVVTLKATITADDMADLVQTYPNLDQTGWSFAIQKVPVGENRAIVMDGLDSGDQIIAQGTLAGFSVVKQESNDIGTIVMKAYANGQTDTTPPDTTITSNTSALSNSTDAALDFICSEAICTFECRLDPAGWSACVSPVFYTGLANGNYLFEVRATDDSGNMNAYPASFSWTVDTTPPDTNITQNPSAWAKSQTADFVFGANETGSSFECRFEGGSWGACSSPVSYSGLAEGSHTFEVRATDLAGNTDPSPASFTWSVDLTSSQTTIIGYPVSPTNQIFAVFQFESSEAGSTFVCQIDSESETNCASPFGYYSIMEGRHTFTVRAIDPAGNIDLSPASYSWTIDVTPPDTTITAKPSNPTNQTTANFEFNSNEAGSTIECRIDSGTWETCSSPKVYGSLTAGDHTFRVRSTDPVGNLELTPAVYTWTIN
ncbi:MAG: hypothetical protein PHE84_07360 [bacterium]|nr:hypothetical protein [bacterium]